MPARLFAAPVAVLRRRLFSSSSARATATVVAAAALPRSEQVSVPCRSNGSITVDVFYGPSASAPVLIYLPSGPVIPEHGVQEERILSVLAASTRATIARVNYRFSPEQPWPTPLHDVLTGYDWIVENMLGGQPSSLSKLGVCGELVGGSLATSLALTECRVGEQRIVAAAVNNPIADWVFPDQLPPADAAALPEPLGHEETAFPADADLMPLTKSGKPRRKRAPKKTVWERNGDNALIPTFALVAQRDLLFPNPHHVFDRFASPIHFFRSPQGQFVSPQGDHLTATSSPSEIPLDPLDFETLMAVNHYKSYEDSEAPPEEPTLTRCRAYSRNYPPATSSLRLPQWHITAGAKSPLLDQASELAKSIKRSISKAALGKRSGRGTLADPEDKKRCETLADQKVRVTKPGGVGLWTFSDKPNGDDQLKDVGQWMAACLSNQSK